MNNSTRFSILLCFFISACSTPKNIQIFESPAGGYGPCEPTICINPKNTKNIVAGSVLDNYHYSMDGGKTWKTDKIRSSEGVYGDPCIIADRDGHFYYFHLADPDGTRWKSDRILESIVVQRSDDNGRRWTSGTPIGVNIPKQQDKEWAASHPNKAEIYVTWTQFDKYGSYSPSCQSLILFSKSTDRGESWSQPVELTQFPGNCIDDDNTVEGAVPAVGPEGNIYVAWAGNEKIYFDRSTDGGAHWQETDGVISDQPGGWDIMIPGLGRANGMPVTCADQSSGSYGGNVYVCWADARNGKENTDIFISTSTDQGKSWGAPVRVNQDLTTSHQFFPWMSVDPKTGKIYIVYYDRSRFDDFQTEVVLAVSVDGGQTFESKVISEAPFTPPGRHIFFGDYNNISAYDGVIRPIWTCYKEGKLSIWTALIKD